MGVEVRIIPGRGDVTPKIQEKIDDIDSSVVRGKLSFNAARILALNTHALEISELAQAQTLQEAGKKYKFGTHLFEDVTEYFLLQERFDVDLKKMIREFSKTHWSEFFGQNTIPLHTFIITCECAVINNKARSASPFEEAVFNLLQRPINSPYVHGELPFVESRDWPGVLRRFEEFETSRVLSKNSNLLLPRNLMDIVIHPSFFNLHKLLSPVNYKPSKFVLFAI